MNPVILIPARLKSTRLTEKALAPIAGKAMIVHVWERAASTSLPVWVACDDARIAAAVEKAGGKAIMTRTDHVSGSDRIFEALTLIDPERSFDVVVNVQGDVPTIEAATIKAALLPLADANVDIATLACEITDAHERTDASVVKLVGGEKKNAVMRAPDFTRNKTPAADGKFYHHIGVYAYRRAALERFVSLPPATREIQEKLEQLRALDAGMRIDAAIVDAIPLGVDTPEHLKKAREILGIRD